MRFRNVLFIFAIFSAIVVLPAPRTRALTGDFMYYLYYSNSFTYNGTTYNLKSASSVLAEITAVNNTHYTAIMYSPFSYPMYGMYMIENLTSERYNIASFAEVKDEDNDGYWDYIYLDVEVDIYVSTYWNMHFDNINDTLYPFHANNTISNYTISMNDRSGGGKVYTFSFKIKCELDLDGDGVFDDNGTLTVSWRIELNSDARLIIADETREYSLSHSSLRMRRVISDSKISELEPFTVEVSTDHAGERIMRYTYYNCSFKYRDKSPVYTKMYKNAEYILKSYNSTTKIYDCTYISAPISFYTTTISEYPFNASYLEYSVLLNDSNTNGIYDVCYMMLNYQPVVMATWLDVQNMLNDSISPYKTTFDNLTFTVVGDGHYKLHAFLDNFEYNFSSAPGYGANGSVYYDDEIKYGSNGILDEYKSELEWIFNDGSRCILSMQDLKTPLSAPPGAPEISDILMQYWMYILILVAALVATIVIIIIIRRKKKSQTK